jgi:hypothetical protein
MAVAEPGATGTELTDLVEQYKRDHPEIAEAMKVFDISDGAYQAVVEALYGPRVTWTESANQPASNGTHS